MDFGIIHGIMEIRRPKLTIIRGVPGSGKSTYAKTHYNCLILENDMFHIHGGEYDFHTSIQDDAVSWCRSACSEALSYGMDVVVANTFTKRRYINSYKALADECGADFEVIRCTGNFNNIHNVPKNVFESMRNGFEDWDGEKIACLNG